MRFFGISARKRMYYVYVIESESSGRYYIGQTGNLEERIERHNKGRVRSTKGRGPWKLKYYFEVKTRKEAVSLEQKLKSIKNRERLIEYCETRGVAQPGPVFARILIRSQKRGSSKNQANRRFAIFRD